MPEQYHVRLEKEAFVFSAAHFITFGGNICERLHGHNYRVFVEVFGPLDENEYVVDFIALRDTLAAITLSLDHHVLLPTSHPAIRVVPSETEVEVTFAERRWVFPRGDCVLLPVSNTTAELVAKYLGETLLAELARKTGFEPAAIRLGVDENQGQWGIWEKSEAG